MAPVTRRSSRKATANAGSGSPVEDVLLSKNSEGAPPTSTVPCHEEENRRMCCIVTPPLRSSTFATEAMLVEDVQAQWREFETCMSRALEVGSNHGEVQAEELDVRDLAVERESDVLLRDEAGRVYSHTDDSCAWPETIRESDGTVKPATVELLDVYRARLEAFRAQRKQEMHRAAKLLKTVERAVHKPGSTWRLDGSRRSKSASRSCDATKHQRISSARLAGPLVEGSGGSGSIAAHEAVLHVVIEVPGSGGLVSEEWLVLGSQPISALRDRIFCLCGVNLGAVERAEQEAHGGAGPRPRLSPATAYIYAEGTFYEDDGDAGTGDLSLPVRQHLRARGIPAPQHPVPGVPAGGGARTRLMTEAFSTAGMDTCFASAWLRVGQGALGVYCHQAGCEHVLTVRGIRRFDPDCDPPLRSDYPFRLAGPAFLQQRPCGVCGQSAAKLVTYGDRAAGSSPAFWCRLCFRQLHYDARGAARFTDYKVFPYAMEYHGFVVQS